ncbi:MAG: hypothetical protein IJA97_03775 [Clostridia bacterium]|nr:hypothetical protein [Clostridia bacterium]
MSLKNVRFLSGNTLKIIAALLMVIDHVGFLLFPNVLVLRYVGRLSMPVFAFMIAEGCRYTKNRLNYFLSVAILGTLCQIVYFIFDPSATLFNILITFSFGILTVYSLDFMKKSLLEQGFSWKIKTLSIVLFILTIVCVYIFCYFFFVDYGFFGCMLPAFASLLDFRRIKNEKVQVLDKLFLRVLTFGVGLALFVIASKMAWFTAYSLISLPLLSLYNGERGRLKMKYFFYLFYPLHLVIIEGIYLLI